MAGKREEETLNQEPTVATSWIVDTSRSIVFSLRKTLKHKYLLRTSTRLPSSLIYMPKNPPFSTANQGLFKFLRGLGFAASKKGSRGRDTNRGKPKELVEGRGYAIVRARMHFTRNLHTRCLKELREITPAS